MPTKVVTMVDRAFGGGGERCAVDIARHLDPHRFESTLCVTRPSSGDSVDAARAAGLRVLELERRSRYGPAPWLRLVRFLREERVDVLHSHKFGSNVWAALVARAARVPVFVAHEHSWSFSGDRTRVFLDRRVVGPRADAFLAVSEQDRRRMVEVVGLDPLRVHVQPNGIPPIGQVDRRRLYAELGCPAATPIVGIVARLGPEKRVDVFLEASALLAKRFPDHLAVVVGGGAEAAGLRQLARALSLERRVRFLGFRSDALHLAAGFDVAVLASDREGSPLTLLEYMALARPIVATRVGGVPDLVRDGEHGLLVAPGRPDELAAAVARLLDDRALAQRLGHAASRRQASEFDLGTVVAGIEDLYERLLAARAADGDPSARPVALRQA